MWLRGPGVPESLRVRGKQAPAPLYGSSGALNALMSEGLGPLSSRRVHYAADGWVAIPNGRSLSSYCRTLRVCGLKLGSVHDFLNPLKAVSLRG